VILLNTDSVSPVELRRGDRIAQLVIQPVVRASFRSVGELSESARGAGGFGSTGGHAAARDPAPAGAAGAERRDGSGISTRA